MPRQSKSVDINVEQLKKFIGTTGLSPNKISRNLGYDGSFIRHIYERGHMTIPSYKLFISEFDLPYGTFIKKEEIVDKNAEVTEEKQKYNLDEINKRLDDLESALNKLGNIEMQSMEYLKDISKGIKKQCDYMGLRK